MGALPPVPYKVAASADGLVAKLKIHATDCHLFGGLLVLVTTLFAAFPLSFLAKAGDSQLSPKLFQHRLLRIMPILVDGLIGGGLGVCVLGSTNVIIDLVVPLQPCSAPTPKLGLSLVLVGVLALEDVQVLVGLDPIRDLCGTRVLFEPLELGSPPKVVVLPQQHGKSLHADIDQLHFARLVIGENSPTDGGVVPITFLPALTACDAPQNDLRIELHLQPILRVIKIDVPSNQQQSAG